MLKWFWATALTVAGALAGVPAFEVATVKTAAPCCAAGQWRESKAFDDRVDFRYVTLRYCIAFAYGMKEYQISGPAWIGELRYDLVAKAPPSARREQLPGMMQTLLAERFKLAVSREKKEFDVYVLVVGKGGPKMKESVIEPGDASGAGFGMSMTGGVGKLEAKRAGMTSLAGTLPRLVGRPVVDVTELPGRYDFDLEFSREDVNVIGPPESEFGTSIFASIQRIGLKLEPRKLPLDAIVEIGRA